MAPVGASVPWSRNNPVKFLDPDGRADIAKIETATIDGNVYIQTTKEIFLWIEETHLYKIDGKNGDVSEVDGLTLSFFGETGILAPKIEESIGFGGISKVSRVGSALAGELHHIASNKSIKSGFTAAYKRLFEKASMSLDDAANKVFLEGHSGAHTKAYKQYVLDYLTAATRGLSGAECTTALKSGLKDLASQLLKNPRMPYKGGL